METRWIEHEADGTLTVDVNGVDIAKHEAAEVEAFRTRVHTNIEGGATRTKPSTVAIVFGGFAFGMAATRVALAFSANPYLAVGAFFLGALLFPALVEWQKRRMRRMELRRFVDRFRMSVGRDGFVLSSEGGASVRVPLAEVHAFDGGRTLTLVRTDGTRIDLPCDLGKKETHRDLAARLGGEVARLRAETSGYRGPRVAEEEEPPEEEEHGAEDGAERRQLRS